MLNNNPFDEMCQAIEQARAVNRVVDNQANNLADLLDGRLQKVSHYRLKKLKAQLQRFNAATGKWKE